MSFPSLKTSLMSSFILPSLLSCCVHFHLLDPLLLASVTFFSLKLLSLFSPDTHYFWIFITVICWWCSRISLDVFSEFRTSISNDLLNTAIWMIDKHLQLSMSVIKLITFSLKNHTFFISVNSTVTYSGVQARKLVWKFPTLLLPIFFV